MFDVIGLVGLHVFKNKESYGSIWKNPWIPLLA